MKQTPSHRLGESPDFTSEHCLGRVLLVTSSFPRWVGDSTTPFVLQIAQDLQELGWWVNVLAPHAKGTTEEEILDDVHIQRFRYLWPSELETLCYQGGALINLRKNRLNGLKLPAFVAAEWLAVVRRLMKKDYDIVHSHWILPQGFTGVMAARPLGVPHVVTVHGSDVFALRGRVLRAFKRFTLRFADAVTVNSSVTEDAVRRIAPGIRELRRIPIGVSTEHAPAGILASELRNRYRVGRGPLLVFVGRLVREKGVEDMIRAVWRLVPRLPDVCALIVGEGQDRNEFERLSEALELSYRVKFCGWVPPDEVHQYVSAADMFVSPSWIEGQGLTLAEAMLARVPVIATRAGGIVDLVKDGETGLLVNVHSPDEIAQAVERLMGDPMLVERIRTLGYAVVKTSFSRKATADAFSELFMKVRATKGPR